MTVMRAVVFALTIFLLVSLSANAQPPPILGPVPSRLYVSPYGQFAEGPNFRGTGIGQVDYHISEIKPDGISADTTGPRKTGVVFNLPQPIEAPQLNWEATNDGFSARVAIVADQAQSLRIHLSFGDPLLPIELRVKGSNDSVVLGPITDKDIRGRKIWLPVTEGQEAILEFFVATQEVQQSILFQIDQINYIWGGDPQGHFADVGLARYKEYDAACWSTSTDYAALLGGVAATAKISFVVDESSYQCSGTLLNDRGSTGTPWFATANHCVSTQTVANSLVFFWHYEATSCGSSLTDNRYRQTYGGAQLLWSNATYDAAFLKLNNPPGSYTFFAGWNSAPLSAGDVVWGIHHPRGDHTMVSKGIVTALDSPTTSINTGQHLTLNDVQFAFGGTEPGSSGSGIFKVKNGGLQWAGALFGGDPSDYQNAAYGPFDNFYQNVKQYLENTTDPLQPDSQPPTTPTGLTPVPASTSQINVYWNASTDNVGVTGYRVYRNNAWVGSPTVNNYTDTGLSSSTSYGYSVVACDSAGNCSSRSAAVTATTLSPPDSQPPTTPTGLTPVPASTSQINVYWNASTDNVGVTGYRVYRNNLWIGSPTVNSYTDTGLSSSTSYSYSVAACDSAGNCSSRSNAVTASTISPPDSQPPTTPTGLTAVTVSLDSVSLAWSPSTDNIRVTSYRVHRNGVWVGTATAANYKDSGLNVSSTYSYFIIACDAVGNCSPPSVTVAATTSTPPDTQAPTVPSGLIAITVGEARIDLYWTAPTDNVSVSSYKIYRNGVFTETRTVTIFGDSGLAPSTAYTYTVAACDAAGNCSAQSIPVTGMTAVSSDVQRPTTPTGLSATAVSSSQINLVWLASTDNVGVTAHKLYRDGLHVVTLGNVTSYIDSALSGGTSYSYSITACDVARNCSAESALVSARTSVPLGCAVGGSYLGGLSCDAQKIVKLLAMDFGIAATTDLVTVGAAAYSAGVTDAVLLNVLLNSAPVLAAYPKLGANYSDSAFVTQLINNIVGPTTSATMAASKAAWVKQYLTELGVAGKYASRGAFVVMVNDVFNPPVTLVGNNDFVRVSQGIHNRIEASAFYAQTSAGAVFASMTQVVNAVATVTEDPATLTAVLTRR